MLAQTQIRISNNTVCNDVEYLNITIQYYKSILNRLEVKIDTLHRYVSRALNYIC